MTSLNIDATSTAALLVLADGRVFPGKSYGALGTRFGEIVFNTGMSGYQETLTDPSYRGQIVAMTSPHIGNTGVNGEDPESLKIWVNGFIVRDAARRASNWRSDRTLDSELEAQNIVGIRDVDTRALTRHLREHGVMMGAIFSGDALFHEGNARRISELQALVAAHGDESTQPSFRAVSTAEPYVIEPIGQFAGQAPLKTVVAIDLGIKAMTPQRLAERGMRVHVVPASTTITEIEALSPDGVFFSNGPGNPAQADAEVGLLREVLDRKIPFFGICFGNQLLARALGYETYKMPFGHRGINQPVQDLTTGKVEITSHNHGYAVSAPIGEPSVSPFENGRYGQVRVSHVGLNDNVVEGLECQDIPAFSVQYHPEAAAGPHDASYLFDRFLNLMTSGAPSAAGISTSTTPLSLSNQSQEN